MNKQPIVSAGLIIAAFGLQLPAAAQPDIDLTGEWMLSLQNEPADLLGQLTVEETADGISAWVEGGPADLTIDGTRIELRIDSRDPGARRFERILIGQAQADDDGATILTGTYTSTELNAGDTPPRDWRAQRYVHEDTAGLAPAPVDFTGMWNGGSGVDMRKYSMDTKEHTEAWTRQYDPNMDQPALRCLSPGVVQLFGYVYPVEIVHTDDRILIINEAYTQVRQIFLDGRSAPDYYPLSRLGFSVGRWEGSTLVVNTTKIRGNIRDFRGEPLSDNATVEERYSLSADGRYLHSTMVVSDPDNFNRPMIRRIRRERTDDVIMLPYECDPDSFYRELYTEGKMEEYWSGSNERL